MKASICIVTYNAEKSIRPTLESIKKQSVDDFEVIIVDDHSTDSTVRIIYNEFCSRDKRFKLYVNCTEEKYVDAYNKSYEYASGEYLFRVEQGSILFQDYLQYHIDFLDSNKEIDALSTTVENYKVENGLSTLIPKDENWTKGNSEAEIIWFNENAAHSMLGNSVIWSNSSTSLRKTFYDKYHPKYIIYALGDELFWWNVLAKGGKLHKSTDIKSANCIYDNNKQDSNYWWLPYWACAIRSGYKEEAFRLQNNIELEQQFKKERLHFEHLVTQQ